MPLLERLGVAVGHERELAISVGVASHVLGGEARDLIGVLSAKCCAGEPIIGRGDIPLVAQPWLDRNVASVTVSHRMAVVANRVEEVVLLEPGNDGASSIFAA